MSDVKHSCYIATAYAGEFTKECMDKLFSVLPENVTFMCDEEGLAFYHTRILKGEEFKVVKVVQNPKEYDELKNNIRSLENTLKAKDRGVTYSDSFKEIAKQELDALYTQLANWPYEEGTEVDGVAVGGWDAQLREFYQQKVNEAGFGEH